MASSSYSSCSPVLKVAELLPLRDAFALGKRGTLAMRAGHCNRFPHASRGHTPFLGIKTGSFSTCNSESEFEMLLLFKGLFVKASPQHVT